MNRRVLSWAAAGLVAAFLPFGAAGAAGARPEAGGAAASPQQLVARTAAESARFDFCGLSRPDIVTHLQAALIHQMKSPARARAALAHFPAEYRKALDSYQAAQARRHIRHWDCPTAALRKLQDDQDRLMADLNQAAGKMPAPVMAQGGVTETAPAQGVAQPAEMAQTAEADTAQASADSRPASASSSSAPVSATP